MASETSLGKEGIFSDWNGYILEVDSFWNMIGEFNTHSDGGDCILFFGAGDSLPGVEFVNGDYVVFGSVTRSFEVAKKIRGGHCQN